MSQIPEYTGSSKGEIPLDKVRVGIVGSKFAAGLHARAYQRCPGAEVIAVAAPDNLTEFADEFGILARYENYLQMLVKEKLDLVSICVPNFLHYPVAMACAAAGVNAISEKPLATKLEHGAEMVRTFRKEGLKLFYAEDWLFAPAIKRAREIINEGAIGEIFYIKAKETHIGSHSPFAAKLSTCGGGAMIHLAVHPAAFVRSLAGSEAVEVMAMNTKGLNENFVHTNFEGEDWGASIIRFENGVRALIEGNYITQGGMDDRIEIYGSKGNLHINLTQGSPISVYSKQGYAYVLEKADLSIGWTKPAIDEEAGLGYVDEINAFVRCVAEDIPAPSGASGADGLMALAIILASYKSAEQGRSVNPQELLKELI
jgi:predicted dehydrogenase